MGMAILQPNRVVLDKSINIAVNFKYVLMC